MSSVNNDSHQTGASYSWDVIEGVFEAVADAPTEQKAKILDQLTAGQPALRAEVSSLLKHDSGGDLPVVPTPAAGMALRHHSGELVANKYRLSFPISVNVNSEVWCGQSEGNGDRVAVKFLLDYAPTKLKKFQCEAATLARLQHPNIAPFVESGCTETDEPFIVMRFVAGLPFSEYCDRHQLSIDDRLKLLVQVCDGLIEAHRMLIVHSDLKPGNILVTDDGQAVLLDFGIARIVAADPVSLPGTLTTDVGRAMTPAYASAEQVRGEVISTATDVHGLGLLLYEIITGHHAYADASHPHTPALFDRICESMPLPPSEVVSAVSQSLDLEQGVPQSAQLVAALRGVSPKALRRRLRGSLDAVTLKALNKVPALRYRSVAGFRADLVNVLERQPVTAGRPHRTMRAAIARRPMTSMAAVAILAMVMVIAAISGWINDSARQQRGRIARLHEENVALQDTVAGMKTQQNVVQREHQQLVTGITHLFSQGPAGDDALASHIPLELRLVLARHATELGKFATADRLMTDLNARQANVAQRLLAAEVWQRLGRPTKGLELLDGRILAALDDRGQRGTAVAVRMRLLMDAQRFAAANELLNDLHFVQPLGKQMLLRAECNLGIQWAEGADTVLTELLASDAREELTAEQLAIARLLRAITSARLSDKAAQEQLNAVASMPSSGWQFELIRCQAMLELGRLHFERREWRLAEGAVLRAERGLKEIGLADHAVALQAMLLLTRLATDPIETRNDATRKQLCQEYWTRICHLEEFGTLTTAKMAANHVAFGQDAEIVSEVLEKLGPHWTAYAEDQFTTRNLLLHHAKALISQQSWARARPSIDQLQVMEATLWGQDSIENVFAIAAQSLVAAELGEADLASSYEGKARDILTRWQPPKQGDIPMLLILPAIRDWESNYRLYDWVDLYLMQRDNSDGTILEMIAYSAEACGTSAAGVPCQAAAELSAAALALESWKPQEFPAQFGRLRRIVEHARR